MAYIYFLTDNTNIKIGTTKDLDSRVLSLQTGNSERLKLLYTIEVEDNEAYAFEAFVHLMCDSFKIKNEWFQKECIEHLFKNPWYKENMFKYR
jgi:hypothetical protein